VRDELEVKNHAIANLRTELERAAGDKQLNLFPPTPTPTPEPVTASPVTEPTPTPTPEPKSKAKTKTKAKSKAAKKPQPEVLLLDSIDGTVAVGGLMEHLLDRKKQDPNFPDPPEKTQTFTDAVTGQTQRLSELENLYGFNLAGYVMKGKKREYRYTIN
jgi:outer membrane biosynthesis protein TonB